MMTNSTSSSALSIPNRPIRIFISTGEVSGDLQGSLLITALHRQAEAMGLQLEIVALGGDRMAAAGAHLLGNTSAIGSIGLVESLPFIIPTLLLQRQAKQFLNQQVPDGVVLIDYMSPNVEFCGYFAKHLPQVPVVYYIAPQEWVWSLSAYNTKRIVQATRRILAIFPEEARYFEQKGANVCWVGHPLVDRMQTAPSREQARTALGIAPDQIAIVLMPASRQQEVKYLWPVVAEAARQLQEKLPQVHFWIPLSLERYRHPIERSIQTLGLRATILSNPSQSTLAEVPLSVQAIAAADLALTKSGTVNLELALLNVPQVVLYKVNPVTAWIASRLLNFSVPYISPVNLVQMKPVVREFLQDAATSENLVQEALDLLLNPERRQQILADYRTMQEALGAPGVCDRAAKEILTLLMPTENAVSIT